MGNRVHRDSVLVSLNYSLDQTKAQPSDRHLSSSAGEICLLLNYNAVDSGEMKTSFKVKNKTRLTEQLC